MRPPSGMGYFLWVGYGANRIALPAQQREQACRMEDCVVVEPRKPVRAHVRARARVCVCVHVRACVFAFGRVCVMSACVRALTTLRSDVRCTHAAETTCSKPCALSRSCTAACTTRVRARQFMCTHAHSLTHTAQPTHAALSAAQWSLVLWPVRGAFGAHVCRVTPAARGVAARRRLSNARRVVLFA